MKKEMLINVLQPEECRIAILEDGTLEELYVERTSQESYVGNVYKGKIVNIEPSIQAAFVDFGIGRNGFLHVSDVDPAYYRHLTGGGQRSPSEGVSRSDERRHDDGRGGRRGDRRDDRRGERQKPREDRGAHGEGPRQRQDDRRPVPRRDDEFDDEPRGRRNPPVREVSERDDDFASGLLDEPPVSARQAAPAVEEEFDDPYAKLVGQFGGDAVDEPAPVKEPKPRRGRSRPDAKPEAAERPTPPPPVVPPAPEPVADDDSSHQFGAGLDLWGDEPPPPLMPTAERRLPEDDENEFGPTSSGFGDGYDDEAGDSYGDQDGDDDDDDDDDGDDDRDQDEDHGACADLTRWTGIRTEQGARSRGT